MQKESALTGLQDLILVHLQDFQTFLTKGFSQLETIRLRVTDVLAVLLEETIWLVLDRFFSCHGVIVWALTI